MEIWKDVKNYEGFYEASNYGRIKRNGKLLKQVKKKNGYLAVDLCKNNTVKTISVHRIIAEAFLPKVEGKEQVNHKNGIKTDNRIENLEWWTPSENRIHAFRTGLQSAEKLRKSVRCKQLNKVFESSYQAAEFLNQNYFNNTKVIKTVATKIRSAANGRQKIAYGFTWEIIEKSN